MTKRIHRDVHVYPIPWVDRLVKKTPMRWEIRCERPSVIAYCQTQKMAATLGRALALLSKAELVVHGRDGTIKRKDSFGNDPCPPKG